ncbi:hypothetical protein [Streptomyces sp. NBC_00690]|uniref:hypothetical protein n=1 Tax=Streptomyces sp. NBC_00690 TaxID=2975808 RepID=UPI002E28C8B9|nr:hypothetical protein [Streptomyces sp. NBC_00690]
MSLRAKSAGFPLRPGFWRVELGFALLLKLTRPQRLPLLVDRSPHWERLRGAGLDLNVMQAGAVAVAQDLQEQSGRAPLPGRSAPTASRRSRPRW